MGTCTVTIDTAAYAAEGSTRAQQRGQRIIRGTIAGSATYATGGGDSADLSNYFPASKTTGTVKYRVILNPISNTGNRLGVYNHSAKKLVIYTSLGVEAGVTDQSVNGIFPFVAVGE